MSDFSNILQQLESRAEKVLKKPECTDHDVILDRKNSITLAENHAGNKFLEHLVTSQLSTFCNTTVKAERANIAKNIQAKVRKKNGCFLEYEINTIANGYQKGWWKEVSDKESTSFILRIFNNLKQRKGTTIRTPLQNSSKETNENVKKVIIDLRNEESTIYGALSTSQSTEKKIRKRKRGSRSNKKKNSTTVRTLSQNSCSEINENAKKLMIDKSNDEESTIYGSLSTSQSSVAKATSERNKEMEEIQFEMEKKRQAMEDEKIRIEDERMRMSEQMSDHDRRMEAEVEKIQKEVDRLLNEIAKRDRMDDERVRMSEQMDDDRKIKTEIEKIQNEIGNEKDERISELMDDDRKMRAEIKKLLKEVESLRHENDDERERISQLIDDDRKMKAEIERLNNDVERLNNDNHNKRKRISEKMDTERKMKDEVERLKNDVERLHNENDDERERWDEERKRLMDQIKGDRKKLGDDRRRMTCERKRMDDDRRRINAERKRMDNERDRMLDQMDDERKRADDERKAMTEHIDNERKRMDDDRKRFMEEFGDERSRKRLRGNAGNPIKLEIEARTDGERPTAEKRKEGMSALRARAIANKLSETENDHDARSDRERKERINERRRPTIEVNNQNVKETAVMIKKEEDDDDTWGIDAT